MAYKNKNLQWITKVVIVDEETGELLTKKKYENDNYEIKERKYSAEYGLTKNTRIIYWVCRQARQQRIEF